jgi:1-pyrroline-4-hydroxy-2-carboxylate deaminase
MGFRGILPALTTPFDERDRVDLDALAANVERTLAAGVHGLVGAGTMGEGSSLSRTERRAVLETIVAAAAGRVPVLAGIAAPTPEVACAFAADAQRAGVSGLMVLPPLLYAGGYEEIAAFFGAVCEAAELPVVAYNNPHAAGYDMSAQLLIRLAAGLEPVVAVKECSGDVRRIPEIIDGSGAELRVLVGGDDWAFEGLCVGADGWISGVADVLPAECVEMYELIAERELDTARELYSRLLPMARFDMTPKLVQFYKVGMDEVGLVGGRVRPPRMALTTAEREALLSALAIAREPAADRGGL